MVPLTEPPGTSDDAVIRVQQQKLLYSHAARLLRPSGEKTAKYHGA